MAVAFDAFSSATQGTGNLSWTHTPVGTPKAVIVFVHQNVGTADEVTSVTYGGTTMTEVSGSPNILTTGESGGVHCFVLLSSVPTGAQTVAVNVNGTGSTKDAVAITLTAGGDCETVDSDGTVNSTASANPSVTLSLNGKTCFCAIAFHSGVNAVANITQLTSWNARKEVDYGNQTAGFYTYNTIDSTDVTAGWTQSSDDAAMIAIAVAEIVTFIYPQLEGIGRGIARGISGA